MLRVCFLKNVSFHWNMEKQFIWILPKHLFMHLLCLAFPPFVFIQLDPSVFYWAVYWFSIYSHHDVFFLCFFSHTGLQVLGHYIRRQQDPETFISEIKYIASDPDDKYFFNVTDEAALNDIVDALGDRIFTLEGSWLNKKHRKRKKEFCCSIITVIFAAENHLIFQ